MILAKQSTQYFFEMWPVYLPCAAKADETQHEKKQFLIFHSMASDLEFTK